MLIDKYKKTIQPKPNLCVSRLSSLLNKIQRRVTKRFELNKDRNFLQMMKFSFIDKNMLTVEGVLSCSFLNRKPSIDVQKCLTGWQKGVYLKKWDFSRDRDGSGLSELRPEASE